MDYKTHIPRWNLALMTVLIWVVGMAVALTPDGLALIEFKNALTVISPLLENWNASDASPCLWGGINCTDSGHVRNITLSAQVPMLEGNIYTSLGKLKLLEGLELDRNMLSGSIPPELGNLSSLRTLSLSSNRLTGGIPLELGNCSSLVILWLDENMLSGDIPESLGNLKNLGSLNLISNLLTGVIPLSLQLAFAALTNLSLFDIGHNLLSGSEPPVIYKNLNLVDYDVSDNNFSGDSTTVLDDLSKLPAIGSISIEDNNFSGTIPPSIGNAITLYYLSIGISYNMGQRGGFWGQIPKELGKLLNLTTLNLGSINLTGPIPLELGNLTLLNNLDLGQNYLTGTIPPELGNMKSLKIMILRDNKLNGTIPSSLGKLIDLIWLGLSNNKLNGAIPSSLGKLVNLTWIELTNNNISGPIPISFTSLINLKTIALNHNGLTGQIPLNLSKTATSLEEIYLQNNSFSGPIPPAFGRFMPNLTLISISNNFFNGTLPNGLCKGGSLQFLHLENNNLEGAIPTTLASCSSLIRLRISDNQFNSIPDGFGSNSKLQILRAARNKLIGQLPIDLGINSQLAYLDLSENKFVGDISVLQFSKLAKNLSVLNLAKNNFTGTIPIAIGMCKLLFQVDLSYNSLTGTVPLTLKNLSSLEELHLQHNKLTTLHPSIYMGFAPILRSLNLAENPWNSPIATEIGSLSILQILNLSYGGYIGPIPSEFKQLRQLEVLDLSHNNLTGEVPSELGELMTSLTSLNISFNYLTGSLPPAWVKFLIKNPTSFYGNPGLCLHYNANNICNDVSRSLKDTRMKFKLSMKVIMGVVLGAITLALLLYIAFRFWKRKHIQKEMVVEKEISEMNLTNEPWLCTFEEIMSATENLSDEYIIGRGAHGVVYKVKCVSDTHPYIAVKKIIFVDTKSTMPYKSFWSEVKSVGKARHRNLVRLLGFIKRDEVGLLLYDYFCNGDLHSALHNTKVGYNFHLTWEARLCIAKGVAHGLAYLHHDYDAPIVHRDIKSSNVLLDDNLEAHISDFGLAKVLGMQQGSKPWLSTQNVLGTYGYIAPEVAYSLVATPQVDVYSYGVLLLELLTGKEPTHVSNYGETLHVVAWVNKDVQFNEGKASESILDPLLRHPKNLAATYEMLFVQKIALLCTQKKPLDRPTMRDVENMFETLSQIVAKKNGIEDWEEKETLTKN